MSLGPNFVRPHLPQLLVLWRNALPKPTSKEGMAAGSGRSVAEWMFLLHHNSGTLVTLDVARRIASVLGNALSFANAFASQNIEDPSENAQMPTTTNKGLSLRAREALLRRRVFQCFSALGFSGITESTQVTLLQSTVSLFASPDGYAGSSVQAAIASSSGSFTSVWQCGDGYAYGVTHLDIEGADTAAMDMAESDSRDRLTRDSVETSIDELLRRPILGACEHDPLSVCQSTLVNTEHYTPEPAPLSTAVVDAAITLFSQLLPLQDSSSSAKIIASVVDSTRSNKFEKNLGRKAAVFVISAVALVLALRVAGSLGTGRARESLGSGQVTGLLEGGSSRRRPRTNFLTSQMKSLVDQVVNHRDPYGRARCSLAFGAIYTFVGGMAAGPLLKTTVNVLMSLGTDPHPLVHFWSLRALAQVINAASLTYAPFVSGTLGMLLKIYCMNSHEREGGSLANANSLAPAFRNRSMAFTASTAYVTEIRLEGLVVLRDVIETFSKSPDPAYKDSLLLEQHQAPITAALTPAFSSDSTPGILASAVHACAVFVGCGVVKDVGRMGRILKLLTTALDQSKESGMVSLGDTGQMSPNASSMLLSLHLSSPLSEKMLVALASSCRASF
ncbi:hypothetical protein AB1N83_012550 [Pleurotus pulmonarius]